MGIFLGVAKFQIFFWVLDIPDIFFFWGGGLTVDAGPSLRMKKKYEYPLWAIYVLIYVLLF